MTPFNVFIIDDDEIDREQVSRSLKKANIMNTVFESQDGEDALHKLKSKSIPKPVVILLDLNMPKINGIEFLELLRNDKSLKSIPVVVLTSSKNEEDVYKAYEKQVAGYLLKPVNPEDFIKVMAEFGGYWGICQL